MAACRLCDPDHVCEWAIEAEQRLIVDGKMGLVHVQIELVLLVVVDEDINMSDEAVKGQASDVNVADAKSAKTWHVMTKIAEPHP